MCSKKQVLQKGLFKLEVWGVKQDLIPYVGQLVLSNVPVEGWIILLDIYGLLVGTQRDSQFVSIHLNIR